MLSSVESYDSYFIQIYDELGTPSLLSLQKVIVAYRVLTYGVLTDFLDDHIRICENTTIDNLRNFVKAIVEVFSEQYLRPPILRHGLLCENNSFSNGLKCKTFCTCSRSC